MVSMIIVIMVMVSMIIVITVMVSMIIVIMVMVSMIIVIMIMVSMMTVIAMVVVTITTEIPLLPPPAFGLPPVVGAVGLRIMSVRACGWSFHRDRDQHTKGYG